MKLAPSKLTKNEIGSSALIELRANGARVRKVHNVSFSRHKSNNQVEGGWSDIQGYSRSGLAVLCEIKTIGDKWTQEQVDLLSDLDQKGGIALVATQVGFLCQIVPWKVYLQGVNYRPAMRL